MIISYWQEDQHNCICWLQNSFWQCYHNSKLLVKLQACGIQGNLRLTDNFLDCCTHRTFVDSSLSNSAPLTSRVVKGSIVSNLVYLSSSLMIYENILTKPWLKNCSPITSKCTWQSVVQMIPSYSRKSRKIFLIGRLLGSSPGTTCQCRPTSAL
jgi:hypothetical protein